MHGSYGVSNVLIGKSRQHICGGLIPDGQNCYAGLNRRISLKSAALYYFKWRPQEDSNPLNLNVLNRLISIEDGPVCKGPLTPESVLRIEEQFKANPCLPLGMGRRSLH